MATHCSILAWKIPWTEEPGGLQSIGLQRIRHNGAHNHLSLVCPSKTPSADKASDRDKRQDPGRFYKDFGTHSDCWRKPLKSFK